MKIFFISDFHKNFDILDKLILTIKKIKPDIIIFSGDIVLGNAKYKAWFDYVFTENKQVFDTKEIKEEIKGDKLIYNRFFSRLNKLNIPMFMVPGNVDAPLSLLLEKTSCFSNINIVHCKIFNFKDYIISGFGGEIQKKILKCDFVNIFSEKNIKDFFLNQNFNNKKSILIFHMPAISKVDIDKNKHKGSKIVNDIINIVKPEIFFCGHAHFARGFDYIGDTLVLNPGALKNNYYGLLNTENKEILFNELE